MQAKQYFKSVAKAVLSPVIKSLSDGFPALGAGFMMSMGGTFRFAINNKQAYGNKIFYAAQNILVRKLTEVPIMFSKQKANSTVKFNANKFYSTNTTNEKRFVLKTLALEELEDHDLNKLFDTPNSYSSGIELMEDFWYNYGFGDGYLWFETLGSEFSRNNKPVAIHSLNRSRVQIDRSTDKFDGVGKIWYTCQNGERIELDKRHVLHLKHWNPDINALQGLGVDQVAAIDINLNRQNNLAQGAAFINGGRGVMFSSDSTRDANGLHEKMTAEQMDVLRDDIEHSFKGAENNRQMHFTNGMVNVTNYGDTLAEMEMTKTEESQWKNIFTIAGVPWVLSPASSTVSENSVIVGYKSLVTNTAIPELRKFDQKLTQIAKYFYPGDKIIAAHDLTEYTELAPDLKLMKEVYGSPLLTVNEQRGVFGYDELPGDTGKAILVTSSLMNLDDLLSADFETQQGLEVM